MGQNGPYEAQGTKLHGLHLGSYFLFVDSLDGGVYGIAGVVDQDVNMVAMAFELSDDIAAVTTVHIKLHPFSPLGLDLSNQLGGL